MKIFNPGSERGFCAEQAIVAPLDGVQWLDAPPAWPDDVMRSQLTERGSITRYVDRERAILNKDLSPPCIEPRESALLLDCGRLWLQEVVLYDYDKV
ncbi:MAG: hypothetical protein GPOALKHO_000046 [Sodalis sp.]|uniref:hypothetical protein n=1 Tax=Sodalis sp. (in: enterobacteria) TaxID=1898979 RepID=UPI00387361AE|nr:MAG: hypothetical protein GPOALKHO_000046 [Sodalis sp.]